MKEIKKILFISMSAGAGHKRAAEALFLSCQQLYPTIKAEHIDLLDYSSNFFKKTTASTYHFIAQFLPSFYGLTYKLTDFKNSAKILENFLGLFKKHNLALHNFINEYSPDLIISTHFLTPIILQKTIKTIPLDMVITDYGLHQFWLSPQVRKFYVATSEIAEEIKKRNKEAIVTGLPIHPRFSEEKNLFELKNKFRLQPDWPTILIMAGGYGLNDQSNLIQKIINDFENINIVAISGKHNEKLYYKYKQIKNNNKTNYQVIKFTEEIDELMRVADIVVTKPGGITLAESAFLNKKIILTKPIPGQEEANKKYFLQNTLAIEINKKNFSNQIIELLQKEKMFKFSQNPNQQILQEALKIPPSN